MLKKTDAGKAASTTEGAALTWWGDPPDRVLFLAGPHDDRPLRKPHWAPRDASNPFFSFGFRARPEPPDEQHLDPEPSRVLQLRPIRSGEIPPRMPCTSGHRMLVGRHPDGAVWLRAFVWMPVEHRWNCEVSVTCGLNQIAEHDADLVELINDVAVAFRRQALRAEDREVC
jgi:hypothetical protein